MLGSTTLNDSGDTTSIGNLPWTRPFRHEYRCPHTIVCPLHLPFFLRPYMSQLQNSRACDQFPSHTKSPTAYGFSNNTSPRCLPHSLLVPTLTNHLCFFFHYLEVHSLYLGNQAEKNFKLRRGFSIYAHAQLFEPRPRPPFSHQSIDRMQTSMLIWARDVVNPPR